MVSVIVAGPPFALATGANDTMRSSAMAATLTLGAGISAGPKWGSYAASKHALRALADALRAEEQPNGLRVTSVYPSHFATDMQRSVREQYGSDYDPARATSPASIAKTIVDLLNTPEDMVINELRIEPPNPLPIRARP